MAIPRNVCAVCGATDGQPHHDPDHSGLITEVRPASERGNRLECQLCYKGLNAAGIIVNPMRPLWQIAQDINQDWANVYFGAEPYLQAMRQLDRLTDSYGQDSARSIVAYFLANAQSWRGPVARRVKAELNRMLKREGR